MNPLWLFLIVPATAAIASLVTLAGARWWRLRVTCVSCREERCNLTPRARAMVCEMTTDIRLLNDTCRVN